MRRRLALCALAALPLLSACASTLAWVGIVTGAIETARALIAQVQKWIEPFREVPGITPSLFEEVEQIMLDAHLLLDQAEKLAKEGGEAQAEAERLYQLARTTIVDRLLKLLAKFGLYSPQTQALTAPPGAPKQLRADGSVVPEAEAVTLPPKELR